MGDLQSDIRAKIIAAAQKAIAELGVSHTTLQVIADGAGIILTSLNRMTTCVRSMQD